MTLACHLRRTAAAGTMAAVALGLVAAGCAGAPAPGARPVERRAVPAGAPAAATRPELMLQVPLGPRPDQPGAAPSRVGGVASSGPRSLAVGPDRTIYLFDSVRGRILAYRDGRLQRGVDVPFLSDGARDLLVVGDRLYVRDWSGEYEIDLRGRIWRLDRDKNPSLYPVRRPTPSQVDKGLTGDLGADASRSRYVREIDSSSVVVRRLGPDGRELARAVDVPDAIDRYVAADGSVYALSWQLSDDQVRFARVHRLLQPAGNAAQTPAATPAALADPPRPEWVPDPPPPLPLRGIAAPDRIELRTASWPPVTVTDRATIHNLWRLLGPLYPGRPGEPRPGGDAAGVVSIVLPAGTGGGSEIRVDPLGASIGADRFTGDTRPALSLLRAALYAPDRVAAVARDAEVAIAIPDLPGVRRVLDAGVARRLVALMEGATRAGAFEPPQPLEAPFPRYTVQFKGQGWETTATFVGDRYLYVGGSSGHDAFALALPPELFELARQTLPVPAASPGDFAYLYGATRLEIGEGANKQDLSRWKATVVRHLLGVRLAVSGEPAHRDPIVFTFTVNGRPEVVRVTGDGFTCAGRFYARKGLTGLAQLQGVP